MRSIRTKILLIVLAFLALIGAAFIFYSISTTVNYKRLRLDGIEEMVAFETEKVNRIIAEIERGAVFYAIGGMLCYNTQSQELGDEIAVEFIRSFPVTVGGGFWFEPYAFRKDMLRAGFYAFYDKEAGEVKVDHTFLLEEYDYHNKDWYREIVDNIKHPYEVLWTRPYIDDSGAFSLMTTAGSGIFDDKGKLIAMSTVDWEIEEVIKELTAVSPTKNSFVLLCAPEKDYIIYSSRTNSSTGESLKTIPWDLNANSFTLNGVDYMRFGRYMDNGWLLSVQIPENEIFSVVERENRRFSIIFTFSSIVILILAYISISRFINAPIKKLTTEVSELSLGGFDTQIKVSSNDELGLLAQTFNKMTGELKKSVEENVRERAEKERIGAELSVATRIQASMLPYIFPPFPDRTEFDIFASMVPAREVGGDFYHFYFIDKDNLMVVIADVSGKGIPAALFMVITKTLIENCSACKTPKAVFESVNKKLCEGNDMGMFVTAFLGFYNVPTGRFSYVNAGHNPPLIKKKNSTYEYIKSAPNLILAFLKDTKYKEEVIFLEKGDTLYLYTDGVTEAMNKNRDMFGEERLLTVLNKYGDLAPPELLPAVKREVDIFTGDSEQTDDITMLALKINDEQQENSNPQNGKRLNIQAAAENLDNVIGFVNSSFVGLNCPAKLRNEIDIAVEELFINIVNYAYTPELGSVSVYVSVKDKITIKFEDTGKPYNPLEQPEPDLEGPPASREIGGLGVFFVKKIMDKVEYARVDNKNILEITKALP